MPESYKVLGYVGVSLGLVLLLFAITVGLFSANSASNNITAFYSSLALLLCGLVLAAGGLISLWTGNSMALRKSQLRERTIIEGKVREKTREIQDAANEIESSNTYLICPNKKRVILRIEAIQKEMDAYLNRRLLTADFVKRTIEQISDCNELILNHNRDFVQIRKREYSYLWKKDSILLDDEQQTAVVTDDKHNLVVAGAGSGKTEVLITRIAYLIKRKPDSIKDTRILAIAYQNKDVKQIVDRLRKDYGIENVRVNTFHKLGKSILQNAGLRIGRNDLLDNNKKSDVVRALYRERLKEPDYYNCFLQYAKTLHDNDKANESGNNSETLTYAQARPYFSINNVKVKSRAEKEIMDFFVMNNLNGLPIDVIYEPDFDGFRPDFYLPKYDIFIEHWALNEKGEVPAWFNVSSEEYIEKMRLKKELLASHNKLLVETFAYEYDSSNPESFIEKIKNRIAEKIETDFPGKYEFSLVPYEILVEIAWGPYKDPVEEIINYITIAKTYGLSSKRIREKLVSTQWSSKQLALGRLAVRIFEDYESYLVADNKIDFEDMINKAIFELEKNPSLQTNFYDQILIDEYQDISAQRYKLVKRLMERNLECKLFCVGDDWQSIMGFSGSNVDFFVNFNKYFEDPAITKLSMNYRSGKTIVDAGVKLITNNGKCQIPKTLKSNGNDERPIQVLRSPHQANYRKRYFEDTSEDCLYRIEKYRKDGVLPKDILVLTRFMRTRVNGGYKFHQVVKIFKEKAEEMGIDLILDEARDESKIRVLTVHKSKGLEAKVVFILNVIKDTYGFPSGIEDSSVFASARENYPEQKSIEEERRLFYVAMTRAREDLIIYTWENSKSEFLYEIEKFSREERLSY